MKKTRTFPSLVLMIVFLLSACGGGNASTPATETATPPEPTFTPQPSTATATAAIAEATSTPDTIASCKLPPLAFTNVGLGLPNPAHKLPSLGDVKTIILFADFPDVPASQSPEDLFAVVSPKAENFFGAISYGRMNWTLEPHFVWLRLGQPSAFYRDAIRTTEGHQAFIQEAVTLADADVDFSAADSVVLMVPPEATEVGYGPALGALPGQGYTADGKIFPNGVTSGADLLSWGYLWLNHESGHTMGLPDLYAYGYDVNNYDDQHRFVGGFGLMGFIDGNAPEFFAFERWQLGWLDDSQINCQVGGEAVVTLTPIEIAGGTKAVMIPLGDSRAVVVESRRRMGYDQDLAEEGVLVYTVDTSVYSGEGAIVVYPILENDPYRDQSPLGVGESVTVEGVTFTVIEARPETDMVQVTVVK